MMLPDGWVWTTIGEIVSFDYGKGLRADRRDPLGSFDVFGSNGIVGKHSEFLIDKPCLIIGRKGAAGQVHISFKPCWPIDTTYYVIPSKDHDLRFLYYLFSSLNLGSLDRSTAIPGLNRFDAYKIRIPLPPLLEQERIVARIESLFTQLDAGMASLKRAQAALKRYRASLLKAACEGQLVPQDPNDEPVEELLRRQGRTLLDDAELPSLPERWCWARIGVLVSSEPNSFTDGPFGSKLKTEHYTESGPRVIRLQNIGEGEFKDEKAYISEKHFETLHKHEIFAGDLVIAALGESLPRACIIPKYVGLAIVKADCMRFKPNVKLADTKYLNFALNSDVVKKQAVKIIHGIGRPRLNQQEVKSLPIPFPPLAEQIRIAQEVERRLSVVQELEQAVSTSLARAARLRQAILRRAFEGRLAPQDPNDEPAEKLIERNHPNHTVVANPRAEQLTLPGISRR